jgi:hypothetical protein
VAHPLHPRILGRHIPSTPSIPHHLASQDNYVCPGLSYTINTIMASQNIVMDRMHFKGHTDKWCREHCNPDDIEELGDGCISQLIVVKIF